MIIMSMIILSQTPHLNTTVVGVLERQVGIHDACAPVNPQRYRYVSPVYRKKYNTYTSILHPPQVQKISQFSPCVAVCRPKNKKLTPGPPRKAPPNRRTCPKHKPLTQTEIRLRVERQTLRDLRTRIRTPPRVTNKNYDKLIKVDPESPTEQRTDKATQITCPPLEVKDETGTKKFGFDRSTQVTSADVVPWDEDITMYVEVISGKITQQCVLELCHEEELHRLRTEYRQLQESQAAREANEAEAVRIETEQSRAFLKVIEQQCERKRIVEDLMRKISAVVTSEALVRDVLPLVLDDLQHYGVHLSEIVEEINNAFTQTLTETIGMELRNTEQEIIMMIIKDEIQRRYDVYTHPETNVRQFEPMQAEVEMEAVEEERKEKKVHISSKVEVMHDSVLRTIMEE